MWVESSMSIYVTSLIKKFLTRKMPTRRTMRGTMELYLAFRYIGTNWKIGQTLGGGEGRRRRHI
jgi:hypothetical protein